MELRGILCFALGSDERNLRRNHPKKKISWVSFTPDVLDEISECKPESDAGQDQISGVL